MKSLLLVNRKYLTFMKTRKVQKVGQWSVKVGFSMMQSKIIVVYQLCTINYLHVLVKMCCHLENPHNAPKLIALTLLKIEIVNDFVGCFMTIDADTFSLFLLFQCFTQNEFKLL